MCGNQAQDATKSHTRTEDAQDAQDANWTSLASGCKADVSDAPYIFADALGEGIGIGKLLTLTTKSLTDFLLFIRANWRISTHVCIVVTPCPTVKTGNSRVNSARCHRSLGLTITLRVSGTSSHGCLI